ncbi:MAG TPA: glycine zipper 2TM domain-containing protein [Eoetvoesiella sp.]
MRLGNNITRLAIVGLLAFTFAGNANAVTPKTRNTVIGAGLGGLAGAVLTEGDPLITLGSAAAGGLLGNIMTEDRRERRYDHRRDYRPRKAQYSKKHYRRGNGGHRHHHR